MSFFQRKESHTITYTAAAVHFTMEELRAITAENHPDDAEVRLISGRKEGEAFTPGHTYREDRKAVVIVTLV